MNVCKADKSELGITGDAVLKKKFSGKTWDNKGWTTMSSIIKCTEYTQGQENRI